MLEIIPVKQHLAKSRFPWKLALLFYALSNGFMLLFLKAYFWDDWFVYYSNSNDALKRYFTIRGDLPIRGILEVNVLGVRPELFRVLTIACFFLLVGAYSRFLVP